MFIERTRRPWNTPCNRSSNMKRALQIILGIGIFGAVFSGVLTYAELFGQSAASCPTPGAAGTILGYPACVYGFFMYLAIAATATGGLMSSRRSSRDGITHDRARPDGPLSST